MFVIASDCLGGHLYRDMNKKHNHPFFWCVIPPNTLEALITNFDIVYNFPKIERSLHWDDWRSAKNTFDVVLNNFHVHFIHNKLSLSDDSIRRVGGDIYYKYAYKLTYDNWERRLERMPRDIEPQFIVTEHIGYGYTEKVLQRLANITKYKLLILTNKKIVGNPNAIVMKISDYQISHYDNGRTQYILNEIKPRIKGWLIP